MAVIVFVGFEEGKVQEYRVLRKAVGLRPPSDAGQRLISRMMQAGNVFPVRGLALEDPKAHSEPNSTSPRKR